MGLVRVRLSVVLESQGNGLFTRAIFGLFVAQHHDWRRRPTATQHPKRRRGVCRLKWNLSQWYLRSDTVTYEAAIQCPVDELFLSFILFIATAVSVSSPPVYI